MLVMNLLLLGNRLVLVMKFPDTVSGDIIQLFALTCIHPLTFRYPSNTFHVTRMNPEVMVGFKGGI